MPLPSPRPISGSRLAPNRSRMMTRMMMSSGIPMLPNMVAPWNGGNRRNLTTLGRLSLFVLVLALGVLGDSFRLEAEATSYRGAEAPRHDPAQFTSGVSAVEVYASVVDASGQPVRGLKVEDFEVLEDGAPQAISTFTAGDFPLTVALALDHSFSMAGPPLAAVKRAARSFLGALRAEDEVFVVGISSRVEVVAQAASPRHQQIAAVDALSAWGTTTLHDSILAAIDTVDGSRGRRALVILSDGDDRYSEASAADAIARARRSNVIVYPIALGKLRPPLFAELSTLTGGRS